MNEPAPLYEKVKRHITDGIVSGTYTPGMKLPSERELVESLSASRMTVSRALNELTRDGIIYRMQGVGSFVSETGPNTSLAEVRDIRDIIAERGGTHACRVLGARSTALKRQDAELFGLETGQTAFNLSIINTEDGVPLQYERRFVRQDFAPKLLEQDFEEQSLFRYLQSIAPVSELEHVVEATLPDAVEAKHLDLDRSMPVLRIRRRTWVGRRVVTVSYFTHPGDRYRVAVRLKPSDVKKAKSRL